MNDGANAEQVKEVVVDMEGSSDIGDGQSTRRRRRGGGGRRRTNKSKEIDSSVDRGLAVDKIDGPGPVPVPVPVPVPAHRPHPTIKKPATVTGVTQTQAVTLTQKVVISPPKKKPAKFMLVPKTKVYHAVVRPQKTFKAKRVRLTIDNTVKTQKKRRMTLARVDAMTEEQLRETAVATKLSRIETVKKVPVDLLRQMLKDYYTMRGMFL
jgi:hypothetical protein